MRYKATSISGRWSVFQKVATVAGPTRTITGEVVNVDPPMAAWGHVLGCPWYETQAEAERAAVILEGEKGGA